MRPHRTCLLLAGLLWIATAQAADFWEKKDYHKWTQQEVMRLLTRSPWSEITTLRSVSRSGGSARSAGNSSERCACCSTEVSVFEEVFAEGGEINPGMVRSPKRAQSAEEILGTVNPGGAFLVRLVSAKPIRMALARYGVLGGRGSDADGDRFVAQSARPDHIVVAIGCVDWDCSEALEIDPALLHGRVYLRTGKNSPQVDFEQYLSPSLTGQPEVIFLFPKFLADGSPVVTEQSRELELVVSFDGQTELRKKFKLKRMMFEGQLEL